MDCLLGLHSGAPLFLYIRWGEITEILEKSGWVIVQKERTLNFSFKCYCTDLKARILFQLVCWHHLLNSKDAEKEECKGRIRTLCLMSQNLFVHQLWWVVLNRKRVASRYAFSRQVGQNVLYKIGISGCISDTLSISPTGQICYFSS